MSKSVGRLVLTALVMTVAGTTGANAQDVRWAVDGQASLAWWQVSPHRHLLWGTTCPDDPAWRPGVGVSQTAKTIHVERADADTVYARHGRRRTGTTCGEAVQGTLVASDTTAWRDARGTIVLKANALVTGQDMRDAFARKTVLQTVRYPEIRFTIDSLTRVEPGETIRGLAVGTFEFRGVKQPMTVPVLAWRTGDGLRVRARFEIPVEALIERYRVPWSAFGLAVQNVWKGVEVGVDVVLRAVPAAMAASAR